MLHAKIIDLSKEKEGENNGQPEPSKEGATPEAV